MGMQGYLIDTRAGAVADIFFHHKGIALSLAAAGCYCHNAMLVATGVLLFAHASFLRIFGYRLKNPDSFNNTNPGSLEKKH